MADKEEQKVLKNLIARRHPEYQNKLGHWEFVKSCYDGGREWFDKNIFRYYREGDVEFKGRLDRCYRFNHTREVVDIVDKYMFKMEIAHNTDDAPESVKKFWEHATNDGLAIKEFIKQVSKNTSIYGRIWIVVDNNRDSDALTIAEEKRSDARTYAYIVTPQNVCDMSYDENGKLNWILIHEQVRDDDNPFESSGLTIDRYRLWTRDSWTLFIKKPKQKDTAGQDYQPSSPSVAEAQKANTDETFDVVVDGPYEHGLGMVPVFPADHIIANDELYSAPSLIDDVAYLDRKIANYLSNLDAIIQNQTFSQLIIPAQSVPEADKGKDYLHLAGTSTLYTYDASSGGKPEYISPDPKQVNVILDVISKNINEIYQTVGLAGERTKEDNALGIDNSSGVAKAYDFERVNSLLNAKADSLEAIENKLVQFVMKWAGDEPKSEERYVSYPDNFDARNVYDEFEIAARLAAIQAPLEIRRLQMEKVVEKLFPQISNKDQKIVEKALKEWEPIMGMNNFGSNSMIGSTGNNQIGGKYDNRVDDAQKGNRKEPKTDTELKKDSK